MTEHLDASSRASARCLVMTTIPRTMDLFLGPHIEMLEERHGFEIHLGSAGPTESDQLKRFPYHEIPFSRSPFNVVQHVKSLVALRKLIGELADMPLLLHLHTPICAFLARAAIPKGRRKDVSVAYLAHGFHFLPEEKNLYWLLERVAAARTDLMLVINDADHKSATALQRRRKSLVRLLPGVGFQPRTEETNTGAMIDSLEESDVVVVGLLTARKDPELALRAIAQIPGKTLTFLGDGELMDELKALAVSLGCADRVRFPGWVADVEQAYQGTPVLLFLSDREGLPMTVVEGAHHGLRVVAFDIRGVRDILEGLNGWVIPDSREPEAVARALRTAFEIEPDVDEYAERSNRFKLENSLEAHSDAIGELLESQVG